MQRVEVKKTYKLFIDGKFPRTESGRYHALFTPEGNLLTNISVASRKDFRNAVVAARKAFPIWSGYTAFLRSQIIYRTAEMLESRRAQLVEELISMGKSRENAKEEVAASIDLLVHYAGWCDKFQQIFSSVNPVASPHLNFSVSEPTGVVAVAAPSISANYEQAGLLGLCATIAPVITGGNTCVLLADKGAPLCAITMAEILNTSDIPAGAVNILTGDRSELLEVMASHRDVDAFLLCTGQNEEKQSAQSHAAEHLQRVVIHSNEAPTPSPYLIQDFQEIKTTWHPKRI